MPALAAGSARSPCVERCTVQGRPLACRAPRTTVSAMPEAPPVEIAAALRRMGLLTDGSVAEGERLTGGVSSDIWRIDLPSGPICVKRALAKLRVAADWQAPVERNRYEARWMQRAVAAAPGSAPRLLGLDEATGALAMQFLPADRYPLWKN